MDNKFQSIFEKISKENKLIALNGLNVIIEAISQNNDSITCTTRDLANKCDNLNK